MTPNEIRDELGRHRNATGIGRCAAFVALADLVEDWVTAVRADQEIRWRCERDPERHGPPPTDKERLAAAQWLSSTEAALAKAAQR